MKDKHPPLSPYNKVEANILLKHMIYWALSEYVLAGSKLRGPEGDQRTTVAKVITLWIKPFY